MHAEQTRRTTLLATAALLALAACWGSTFFLIKDLLDRVPTLDFLALRFSIASLALLVVAPRALGRLSPVVRRHAVVLGLLYGVAQILQTTGLAHTPASISGFVTGLYVVCTPLLAAAILRTRIPPITWAAVALATVGLGVLALRGLSIGYGELITLASAVLYALHIVGLGAWSTAQDAVGMTILQVMVIALVCTMATAHDGIVLPDAHGRLGGRCSTWPSSSARSACSARPGRRPTCRRPARAHHHEHGAGVRLGLRRLARRRGPHDRGCSWAARWSSWRC